ncbi:hypothetical protein Tco_1176824 [Tanacetum coccineum]
MQKWLQIQDYKVQEVKALNASSGNIESSRKVSNKGNANSSGNDCSKTGNDQSLGNEGSTSGNEISVGPGYECSEKINSGNYTDIRPSYDAELMAELQDKTIAKAKMRESWNKMKGKGVDTNFKKPSILGKPPLQTIRNQPVVRQPNAFKSKRSQFSKTHIASQVVEKNALTKPVTPHSWPQVRQYVFAKPHHVNAPASSWYSSNPVSNSTPKESVGSNDMVQYYYLEEAKKKAQLQKDKTLNAKPSVITPARLQNTTSGSKPKPRNYNQQTRN